MTITESEQRAVGPKRWNVDRAESSVGFDVETFWGLITVHGHFDSFEGRYERSPEAEMIELTVDAASLDTGNAKRDEHLRSDDFFSIEKHPQVRFISTRIHHVTDGILHVVGNLEAAGKVVTLEFAATMRPDGDALEIETTTTVDQRELGMSSGRLGMIRPPATLHVKARLSR